MNPAITAEDAGLAILREPREGTLSFLVSRSKKSVRVLSPSAAEVFKGCSDAVRQLLCTTIETRSQADFDRVFESEFPRYISLIMAMSNFAGAVVPKHVIERLTRESICELEADFREKGLEAFGAAVRDQALFTIWTLGKINELVTQIVTVKPDESKKKDDAEYCSRFNFNMFRAQFSLDCLNTALETGQAIYPQVLEELTDGLRAMVNAYTWARRGLESRIPSQEPPITVSGVDEEDLDLMEASFNEASDLLTNEGA